MSGRYLFNREVRDLHASIVRPFRDEWILATLEHPGRTENDDSDPPLVHALRAIPEKGFRVLRVIYDETTGGLVTYATIRAAPGTMRSAARSARLNLAAP